MRVSVVNGGLCYLVLRMDELIITGGANDT